jgi:hypothetical protein
MAKNTIDLKYLVNYDQLKAANAEILKTGSNAQKSASVFEKSFRKVESENKKALNSVNQRIAFSKRMEAQKAKEARVTQQAAEQEARALERLRQKYDQGHVAMEVYSRELNDLGTALKRNIITKSQYTKELERLNTATKMGTVVSSEFGAVAGQMGRRMSRTGVIFQQSGYQIGDFIVQVQSGQNAMVAFGQQATQMAGTLTLMGGKMLAIGTALGVAIPLVTAFGAAWLRTRKGLDESSEALKTLEQNLNSLDSKLKQWFRTKKAASLGITVDELLGTESLEQAGEDLKEAKDAIDRLVRAAQAGNLMGGSGGFALFGGRFNSQLDAAREAVEKAEKRVTDLKAKEASERERLDREVLADSIRAAEEARVELTRIEIESENERMRREHEAIMATKEARNQAILEGIEVFRAAQKRMRDEEARTQAEIAKGYANSIGQAQTLKNVTVEYQQKMVEVFEAAKLLRGELGESAYNALRLSGVDVSSGVSAAAKEAAKLAANLNVSLLAATNLKNLQDSKVYSGRGGDPRVSTDYTKELNYKTVDDLISSMTSKGGGASQKDLLAKLRERIKLDTELLGKSKERQAVERAIANSEVSHSQTAIDQAVAELKVYNQIIEKRQELQGIQDTAKSSIEDGFMSMIEGTKSVEDAFKDMARSIIKELYDVYVIQRLVGGVGENGSSGTGLLGLLGGLFGKASGGTVQSNQPYLVGEKGPELIVPRNRGHVMNADLTADALGGGGGVTVVQNFNFQANGDDSVKKIIAQAAPSIANMAKQSVMDARRRGGAMKNAFG